MAEKATALGFEVRRYLLATANFRRKHGLGMPEGFKYGSFEDFVLKNGRAFRPGPLPRGIKPMTPGYCFSNAADLAELHAHKGWYYVEGYAVGRIPVLHAWCGRPADDLAIDPTWPRKVRQAYFGVPFRLEFLLRTRTDECATLIDRPREDWPLLRGTVPEEVWRLDLPGAGAGWRYFKFREIAEARAHAAAGGVAVHDSGFKFKGKWACHLFAKDPQALEAAARAVGCALKWIQYPGTNREHYDLFALPLEKALARCPNRPATEPTGDRT